MIDRKISEIEECNIFKEVKIYKPNNYLDKRGKIWTSWEKKLFPKINFNLDKFTISKKNVLRGFHGDPKSWKLVTCVYGEVLSTIVDYRSSSKTFKKNFQIKLSEKNNYSLLIPPNFLNAWLCLSNTSVYQYKYSFRGKYVDANKQITVAWNNSDLNINWPIKKPILSIRDNI